MPTASPPTEISLRIKVPPGYLPPASTTTTSSDSQQFSLGMISTTTSLASIRTQIQSLIPTHPPPDQQRILYGGRALVDDEQTIGDALNVKRDPAQGEYVVHLLVKGGGAENRAPTPNAAINGHERSRSTPTAAMTAPGAGPALPNTHPTAPSDHQSQLLQQHRVLARQLEMQHHAFAQQLHAGLTPGHPPQAQANGMTQTTPAQSPQPTQQGGPAPAQQLSGHQNPAQQPPPQQRVGQGFHIEGVGPNGQRFQIHQQTMNFPAMQPPHMNPNGLPLPFPRPMIPGQQIPLGFQPPIVAPFPLANPNLLPNGRTNAPSALARARENMTEMRRMLDELATQTDGANDSHEQRRRKIEEAQRRARSVEEYIDPFGLGNRGDTTTRNTSEAATVANGDRSLSSTASAVPAAAQNIARPQGLAGFQPGQINAPTRTQQNALQAATQSNGVTAYLLSSPQGPQAILFSPEHGTYTGHMPLAAMNPAPTSTFQQPRANAAQLEPQVPGAANHLPADPAAQIVQQQLLEVANAQAQAADEANQDPFGLQPILAHFWLLFRILVFAYFIMGSNLGWRRPLILAGIGLGFWMVRLGMLGDGGAVRRWWDGIVGAPRRREALEGDANAPAPAPAPGQAQPANTRANAVARMPTPEQVAARLLNEADARQQQRRNWLREQLRPVERAVALFVASLWPGIGEGYVREQRRLREEEEAQDRANDAQEESDAREKSEVQGGSGNESGAVSASPSEGEAKAEGASCRAQDT